MRLISELFRRRSALERRLEKLHVQMLQTAMNMSFSEAREMARTMVEQAKQDAERERTTHLPQNFGDILLDRKSTDEKIKSMLARLRKEGVRDDDVRWWWDMHDLERRMLQQADLMYRGILFLRFREEGLSPEDAAKRVAKRFPVFGNADDTTLGTGSDRPLPYELKSL